MTLPFTREQFLDAFAQYNRGVWPAQLVLFAVAIACLIIVLENRGGSRAVGMLMGLVWAWTALAYHVTYFRPVNPAAWLFGGAFLVAANALSERAASNRLVFGRPTLPRAVVGTLFLLYGTIGYPLVAQAGGLELAQVPTFGLPCPTTIFTLGLLLFARDPVPTAVLVVPLAWSVVGTIAAFSLRMYADLALPVAGLVTAAFLFRRRTKRLAVLGLLSLMGCGQLRYAYEPVTTTSADVEGRPAAVAPIDKGELRLASLGIAQVTPPSTTGGKAFHALFVRFVLDNQSDEEWALQQAEQAIEVETAGRRVMHWASTMAGDRPGLTRVPAHGSASVDLLFPLGAQDEAHLTRFEVVWTVRPGTRVVSGRAAFAREIAKREPSPAAFDPEPPPPYRLPEHSPIFPKDPCLP